MEPNMDNSVCQSGYVPEYGYNGLEGLTTIELNSWENRPFTAVWPEENQTGDSTIKKTIKKKPKRTRTAFTTEQIRTLENTYNQSKYIDAERRKQLALSLNISDKSIKVWFQNRRMKEKRESSESSNESSSEVTTSISPGPSISQAAPPMSYTTQVPENGRHDQGINQYQNVISNPEIRFELPQYQVPNTHFYNQPQYSDLNAPVSNILAFNDDRNVYSTCYYPNVDYSNGGHSNANSVGNVQWTLNNFDLNFFQ